MQAIVTHVTQAVINRSVCITKYSDSDLEEESEDHG